ncbi:MAG TPA: hypothetical protein VKH63_21095 [Candidatus Acidoferrum sp.]|nr:hypothetical protein [Candidatus Acidoferrum sp.]
MATASNLTWRLDATEKESVAIALLAADIVSALLYAIFCVVSDRSGLMSPVYFALCVFIGLAYTAAPITILALPVFFVFRRIGLVNAWSCLLSGFLMGSITASALAHPRDGLLSVLQLDWSDDAVRLMAVFGGIGTIAAASFWVVLLNRRRRAEL